MAIHKEEVIVFEGEDSFVLPKSGGAGQPNSRYRMKGGASNTLSDKQSFVNLVAPSGSTTAPTITTPETGGTTAGTTPTVTTTPTPSTSGGTTGGVSGTDVGSSTGGVVTGTSGAGAPVSGSGGTTGGTPAPVPETLPCGSLPRLKTNFDTMNCQQLLDSISNFDSLITSGNYCAADVSTLQTFKSTAQTVYSTKCGAAAPPPPAPAPPPIALVPTPMPTLAGGGFFGGGGGGGAEEGAATDVTTEQKPFPWWIIVVLVGGIYLLTRKGDKK